MSTRTHARGQAASEQADTPVQTGLLQRRHTEQAETATLPDEQERQRSPDQSLDSATPRFRESRFNHDFSQVPVHSTAPPIIQTKLRVGQPGDRYEQEADRVAESVMRMPEPGAIAPSAPPQGVIAKAAISGSFQPPSEEKLQRQPMEAEEEEEEQDEVMLQAKELPGQTPSVPEEEEEETLQAKELPEQTPSITPEWEARLKASSGSGQPLPEPVRAFMEPRFDYDFSQVRVHTNPQANRLASELNAKAFTQGQDIFFGSGYYQPQSKAGQQLLAHELTHTIQQRPTPLSATHTPVQARYAISQPGDSLEQEAEAVASQVAQGYPVAPDTISAIGSGAQGLIARQRANLPTPNPQGATLESTEPVAAQRTKVEAPLPPKPKSASSPTGASLPQTPRSNEAEQQAALQPPEATKAIAEKPVEEKETQKTDAGSLEADTGEKSPTSPEEDPAFQAVVERAKGVAAQEQTHAPAEAESAEAQQAAEGPPNEVSSLAAAQQVGEMDAQQPQPLDREAFKQALLQKIAEIAPQTLEEADKFKDSDRLESVKGDLSSQVNESKQNAQGELAEKVEETPDTSGIEAKPVTPLSPADAGAAPADIKAEQAAPKAKRSSEVETPLQETSKQLDQQMAEADISEEQLANSNEPTFQAALDAKRVAQTNATEAPQAYRQQEQATLTQAQDQAQTTAQTQLEGMHGEREQLLARVVGLQEQTKGQDEQERSKVATDIEKIYEETRQTVETHLSQLDTEVNSEFERGAAAAKTLFENYVDERMKLYKEERYSGATGWARWLKDKLLGMPSEVNAFYQEGRQQYLASMNQTIDTIANLVATRLNEAKAEIAGGKQEIQKYVASLPESLRQVGQQAAQDIQGKFDALEQSVDNKQNELIDSLAQKYREKLQDINARIDEMKAANRGFVDTALDAVGGAIQTILELKNMLMSVLSQAAGAVELIIKDPIAFLGNLVTGLKQGFENFAGNIWEHLKKGLLGWLTGAIAGAGIQMPESLDLKDIFSLVMQVLGMAYSAIRSRVAKVLGEETVSALESSFEIFIILKNEGVAGLWQFVQDKIGDLKAMVIDTIQNFVVGNVIKAGVTWIISLLNPASAFVKACKAIYDIIMFFIERGSQIVELVNAVMESVTAIASGSIAGAAKAVENALSKSLPVVISFMASLLGLGGISDKIQEVIKRVRQPIEKAIDWVIAQAVKFAKKIGKKFGFGKDKKGKPNEGTERDKKERLEAAVNEVQQLMNAPGATVQSVEEKLPSIQGKYELKSLNLVKEKKGAYHVHATINPALDGPPGVLFTREELQQLEAVAKDFAEQINKKEKEKPGTKARFLADPESFIRAGKVNKSGDVVEAASTPGIEQLAAEGGLTVMRNAYIQFVDAAGKSIGGRGPELDFLILGPSGVTEIVSAKLKPGEYKPKQDRKLLGHFVSMPLTPPGIVTYAQTNFGTNKAYVNIAGAKVISNLGEESLESFRAKYLSKVVVDKITVTSVTPGPEESQGLQLRVTEPQLLAKVVELMKKYL